MKQLMIKCNVGPEERRVRFFLGIAAAAGIAALSDKGMKKIMGGLGLASLITAATRYDPIYHLLGINHGQPAYRAFPHLLRRL